MLTFKHTTLSTYNRNIKSGKWEVITPLVLGRSLIRVPQKSRGVYNVAGRTYLIEIIG